MRNPFPIGLPQEDSHAFPARYAQVDQPSREFGHIGLESRVVDLVFAILDRRSRRIGEQELASWFHLGSPPSTVCAHLMTWRLVLAQRDQGQSSYEGESHYCKAARIPRVPITNTCRVATGTPESLMASRMPERPMAMPAAHKPYLRRNGPE